MRSSSTIFCDFGGSEVTGVGEISFNVFIDDIEFDLDVIKITCSLSNTDLLLSQPALERPGVVLTVTDGNTMLEIQLPGDMADTTKFPLVAMDDCYLVV